MGVIALALHPHPRNSCPVPSLGPYAAAAGVLWFSMCLEDIEQNLLPPRAFFVPAPASETSLHAPRVGRARPLAK